MTAVGVNVGPTWDHDSLRSEYTNSVGNVAVSPDPDGKRAYVTYGATIVERGCRRPKQWILHHRCPGPNLDGDRRLQRGVGHRHRAG